MSSPRRRLPPPPVRDSRGSLRAGAGFGLGEIPQWEEQNPEMRLVRALLLAPGMRPLSLDGDPRHGLGAAEKGEVCGSVPSSQPSPPSSSPPRCDPAAMEGRAGARLCAGSGLQGPRQVNFQPISHYSSQPIRERKLDTQHTFWPLHKKCRFER